MAINRFDVYQPQGHVSQYVPLPFEELAAVGQQMQKNYEGALTDIEALPGLLKDAKGLKEVTGYGERGLGKYYVGDLQMINDYNADLKNRLNSLTDDIMTGKLKGSEYKTEISKLKNQVTYDLAPTGKIGQATARYNTYQKNLEEMQKAKDLNKAEWLAAPIYQNVGQFLRGQGDIQSAYVGDYVDRNKELNDALSHIKSVGWADASTDGKYIREGSWEKVPEWKIKNAFNGWFENSAAKSDIENELSHRVLTGRVANTEEAINTEYDRLKNNLYNEALGLYQSSKYTSNLKTDANYGYTREDKALEDSLVGDLVEGTTLNLIEKDKNFADKIKSGIYKKNPDGTYSIDEKKLNQTIKVEEASLPGSGLLMGTSKVSVNKTTTSDQNKKEVERHMKEMAKIVGEKDVSPKNYNKILNQYAAYSKIRAFDEQMSGVMSNIETNKVINNFNNYDVMDPNNPDKPLTTMGSSAKPFNPRKDQLIVNKFEMTPSGKMNRSGYILRENGEKEKVILRPQAKIDNNYHNEIADLSVKSIKYESGFGSPAEISKDGVPIVDRKLFAGVGFMEAFEMKDKNGKKKVGYLYTPTIKGEEPQTFSNQGDMLRFLDSKYLQSDVGNSDRYYIAPAGKQFEGSGN